MSKEKKELNNEELNDEELKSVNGGSMEAVMICNCCNQSFDLNNVESRRVEDGCDFYYEHKYHYCGNWYKYI